MGGILVILGIAFLLSNLGWFHFRDVYKLWPALLVAAGVTKFVESRTPVNRASAGFLALMGAFLLAVNLGYIYFDLHRHWPVILIVVGIWIMIRNIMRPAPVRESFGSWTMAGPVMDEVAVFSGGKRIVTAQDFRGGEIAAVFGGFEIDLHKAGMASDEAVIEANAVFGGIDIRIPENWSALVQGIGVFGGFDDKTEQPNVPPGIPVKRLIIKGAAVFGGVVVKN